jgi:hypothetical protein
MDMIGGQDWWAQIEQRIAQAGAAVLVVTPAALKSPVVRREWLHARRVGTPCLPVTDDPNIFTTAPRWLRSVDVFIFAAGHPYLGATWDRFLHQVDVPPALRPVPFMAPGLPAEFVPRNRARDALVHSLLNERQDEPAFSTVILEAPPGFGKTVLAQDVCHDQRIIDTFTGGVLWVTFGEHGQGALPGLSALATALSGTPVTFNTVEDGEPRLTELLQSRDCLLVLDDVWDLAHAAPFLVSTNLTRLITTRSAQNLPVENATVQVLDEMTANEATQTLLNFIPGEARASDPEAVRSALAGLAGRLGEWPLLLGIFGGTLRTEITVRGRTFPAAIAWVDEGLDAVGLTAFDRGRFQDRNAALAKSVDVSLRAYAEAERQRLFELAIFPPAEPIPEAVAVRLWKATASMAPFAAGRLLREFAGTFFKLVTDATSDALSLRFHDALREHLGNLLTAPRADEVHRLLLTSYLAPDAPPDTVPDDGYLYDHIAYHLRHGDGARLHAILRDPRWFRARVAQRVHTYDGYLVDLAQGSAAAFAAACGEIDAGESPRAIVELTRYRLARATIDALAGRFPPELMVRALELGLRTPAQALSIASRVPDPAARVRVLQQLLAVGSPLEAYRGDLETLAAQTAEDWREPSVFALAELADHLQGASRDAVLRRALRATRETAAIRAERSRAGRALGRGDGYSADREIAHGLAAVAKRLAGEQRKAVARDGVAVARGLSDPKERAHALAAWLGVTDDDERRACYAAAIEAARQIDNQQERLFALSAIARGAGGDEQRQLLDDIWAEATATIADEPWCAFCLSRAAPQFDPDRRRQCVELALRAVAIDRRQQVEASAEGMVRISRVQPLLEPLVPSMSPREIAALREVIERVPTSTPAAQVMLELGLPLTDADIQELFAGVLERRNKWYSQEQWLIELARLAPQLPAALVTRALTEAAQLTQGESEQLVRLEARGEANGRDQPSSSPFYVTPPGRNASRQSWLLAPDAPTLSAAQIRAELDRIKNLADDAAFRRDSAKSDALRGIIGQASEGDVDEIELVAASVGDGWYRSLPLAALALRFGGDQLASNAVDALLEPGPANADRRAAIIEQLVPVLTARLVSRLLTAVQSYEEWGRIRALKALMPRAAPESLSTALEAIRSLTNDSSKAELLPLLVNSVDEQQLSAVIDVAEGIDDESFRLSVLQLLASRVKGPAHERVLAAAQRLKLSEHRVRVLARLLPSSPERDTLVTRVRRELSDYLHQGPRSTRPAVLELLTDPHVAGAPVLDQPTLQGVVLAATDVCRNWPWEMT